MENKTGLNGKTFRIVGLGISVAVISGLHFLVPTEPHWNHQVHIVLRKLYFLPPVMAGAWFGLRGAFVVTSAVSILFTIHAFLDWPQNYMEQANQLGELASFWVVGLVPGYLFERQKKLLVGIAQANEETLMALVSALDLRERNTRLHSQRVKEYTLLMADRFGVSEAEKKVIGIGALLHDVGKIAVPDHILLKPSQLSKEEWKEMRRHPEEGFKLLQRIDFLRQPAEIVYTHHERFDGSGYPRGLKGEDIPLGARLFMVADVFDALTSERPYRVPLRYGEAAADIAANSGKHFDPAVVDVFQQIDPEEWVRLRERLTDADGEMPPATTSTP
ncbi:HD-GYP domain-containing protein [Geobacter sp. DSM 9736]|uniref:HD-GYP domain-containing protein n=1 Tax=Geobacter sp. DSM 9736 TaxID=1277350 RepID=UPI000B50BAD0|nr:HD domain-containing phosphohydrolase [Geobacter sp. DSM 9736]SNB45385.1 HDIG domain-containing protein [Geobacter sp. DSM 9736]